MAIVTAIAVVGRICSFMIGGIALWGEKVLARGWNEVPRHMDDGRLPISIKNMPANETGRLDGHHMIYHAEVSKLAFNQGFLKVI